MAYVYQVQCVLCAFHGLGHTILTIKCPPLKEISPLFFQWRYGSRRVLTKIFNVTYIGDTVHWYKVPFPLPNSGSLSGHHCWWSIVPPQQYNKLQKTETLPPFPSIFLFHLSSRKKLLVYEYTMFQCLIIKKEKKKLSVNWTLNRKQKILWQWY